MIRRLIKALTFWYQVPNSHVDDGAVRIWWKRSLIPRKAAIICLHGGGFTKRGWAPWTGFVDAFKRDYVVAELDWSIVPEGGDPVLNEAEINELANRLRRVYRVQDVYVIGTSAGGTVANVCSHPGYIDKVVSLYAITGYTPFAEPGTQYDANLEARTRSWGNPTPRYMGPTFAIHGTQDSLVPVDHVDRIPYERLKTFNGGHGAPVVGFESEIREFLG